MISIGIADDDGLVRHMLTDLLSRNGDIAVAWVAKDGQEALDFIRSNDIPDIQAVLLDVQMPRLDGLALAEILRDETPDLAILILTTFTADSIVDRALAAGVRGFVAKEDNVATLAGAIQQAVEGNLVLSPTSSSSIVSDHLQGRLSGPPSAQQPSIPTVVETEQAAPPRGVALSGRELDVLELLVDSLSNKQIARRLGVSEATIKTHVSAIIAKLGVQDRVGAAVYALRHNMV
ncbi:response regulator [Actinomyces capricornis]|nr:response regulator transcription factor [Actinomyces capricornis]